ncbi:MAG: nucleotidyl transferase AbiEii/AbiGii toxin family protein [Deltaproteobacteria bacterium]|nr:nucleotidyl transferase AbiEii/AbiGii toxin family protein [Deltaproteobacteria bacterium]
MNTDLIIDRLNEYLITSKQEEINALKEIYQEIALAALARSDFFKIGAFHGGTCLRIVHGLRRFSEDLDFQLIKPQKNFEWHSFLVAMKLEFKSFGLTITVKDRSKAEGVIKKAFLKQGSFGQILELKHPVLSSDKQSILIKLEIDTNPPEGSSFESHFLQYPFPFSITTQDQPSLFAGKLHALLYRGYLKGRDWFDFLWYISKKTPINYTLLGSALVQTDPNLSTSLPITRGWLVNKFDTQIRTIDWHKARFDVQPFLTNANQKMLDAWSQDLFLAMLEKLP